MKFSMTITMLFFCTFLFSDENKVDAQAHVKVKGKNSFKYKTNQKTIILGTMLF